MLVEIIDPQRIVDRAALRDWRIVKRSAILADVQRRISDAEITGIMSLSREEVERTRPVCVDQNGIVVAVASWTCRSAGYANCKLTTWYEAEAADLCGFAGVAQW